MANDTLLNKDRFSEFCYWVIEREQIRHRKAMGAPKPWTLDPILQRHHFCNVRREDDRGTKERRAVVRKYIEDPADLPWAYALSNLLNHAPSLEVALLEDDWVNILQKRMDAGGKVFNTAYIVSTNGISMPKLKFVAMVSDTVAHTTISDMSCIGAFRGLYSITGLGSFLAGQIVADLKNDRYLARAPDFHSFSVMGPGSKKGLVALYGMGVTHSNYQKYMDHLYSNLPPNIKGMNIHMQDLQNCLCEISKYFRYKHNQPGRRRNYV